MCLTVCVKRRAGSGDRRGLRGTLSGVDGRRRLGKLATRHCSCCTVLPGLLYGQTCMTILLSTKFGGCDAIPS